MRNSATAVIFDLDGVLVDSEPIYREGLRRFLAPDVLTDEQYGSIVGISERDTWLWVQRTYGRTDTAEAMAAACRPFIHRARASASVEALAGAHELLALLRGADCRLAVASQSSPGWVAGMLDSIGLGDAFDTIVTASQVREPKPAPDIYLRAASLLRVAPSDCIAVEDSHAGIESATAAGMRVVQLRQATYVAPAHPLATVVVSALGDFPMGWVQRSAPGT